MTRAHDSAPPAGAVASSDIAVVGMACRFPGALDPDTFWRNIRDGVEAIVDLTRSELEAAGVEAALLADPNYVRRAAPLEDMDGFDAGFFGFSPKDAAIMDPQHRQFLEVAWEALESAGHPPERFEGSIGVYAGCGMNAYMMYHLLPNRRLMSTVGLFLVRHTGNDKDFLSTRVSYSFDLRGPSVSVQTACSTSLVAVHMACQNLLAGECDMAIAGGVTIELPHRVGYLYQEGEILSHDGRCRAFDADSTGTVFGSGAGVVVLRRVQDAIDNGDCILAVIKGSAINNDGSSKVGYLAPSVDGQAQAIAEAQAVAGVSPETVTYVETHGTGTQVGDPIEVEALTQAFRRATSARQFCGLGSVKTNIGHTDTAAGVASLIKAIQALRHRQLPPSLHFSAPNPLIDFAASPFYVNDRLREWSSQGPRRAGVSSLGVGGTNAHVVLEEAPSVAPSTTARSWHVVPVSARTPAALERATERLATHLERHPDVALADVAFTLQRGRREFPARRVVAGTDTADVARALRAADPKRVFTATAGTSPPGVVFLFPGGGAQYPGMGRELYEAYPIYREEVDRCLDLLKRYVPDDVRSLMFPAAGGEQAAALALERPSLALPALFATSYGLARLWMAWGIEPAAMCGHSMGEYVAACLADVMSLDAALRLVTSRGSLFERVPEGGMLSVPLSEQDLVPLLPAGVSLAAVNGPALAVASGPLAGLRELEARLTSQDVESQRLHIAVAAHSAMLDGILDEFEQTVRGIDLMRPARPFVSNVTGRWADADEVASAAYWVRHLRQTVRFDDGLALLLQEPGRVFIEVGPGTTLSSLARAHPGSSAAHLTLASLRHPRDPVSDLQFILTSAGRAWAAGVPIDWPALDGGAPGRRVPLPTYPFEHTRHWIEAAPRADAIETGEPAVAARIASPDDWYFAPTWKRHDRRPARVSAELSGAWLVFLDDFGLGDAVVAHLRAEGQAVVAVEAGRSYHQRNVDHYVVAPGRKEDYDAMMQALLNDGKRPVRVLHLWALSRDARRAVALDTLDTALDRSFYSLLFLAQALASSDASEPVRLVAVSNGMQQVIDEPLLHPEQATMLGPCRVISREFPACSCVSVDIELPRGGLRFGRTSLPDRERRFLVDALIDELVAEDPTTVVAYRHRRRWTQVFEPARLPAPGDDIPVLRPRGVYLITGGLGALGLAHADYLARTCKARIALLGRTRLPPREEWSTYFKSHGPTDPTSVRIRLIEQMQEAGAEVLVLEADVVNLEQTRTAIAAVKQRFGTLHGVIHAAGTIADTIIPLKTKDSAESVLSPKVRGTLVLHEALGGTPLDFFAVFSSTSAVLGPPGQVDYVAANAFLDAFVQHRAAVTSQRALSIAWGLWKDVGMAVESARLLGHAPAAEAPTTLDHPLLQTRQNVGLHDVVFSAVYSADGQWILDEHRLSGGTAVVPGTGYLELFRAVGRQLCVSEQLSISEVSFVLPLAVGDRELRHVRIVANARADGYDVSVSSFVAPGPDQQPVWREHATAHVSAARGSSARRLDITSLEARCPDIRVPPAGGPQTAQEQHLRFGPRWKNVVRMRFGNGEALAELELDDTFASDLDVMPLHPALVDLATGFALPLLAGYDNDRSFYVPLSYRQVDVHGALPRRVFAHARCDSPGDREAAAFDYCLMDETGRSLVEIEQFVMRRVGDASALSATRPPETGATPLADARPSARAALPVLLELGLEHGISPAEGVAAFARALQSTDTPHVVVSSLDLDLLHSLVDQSSSRRDESPAGPAQSRPTTGAEYVAPRGELERKIAAIWQEILGLDRVGLRDNFFDLGGHSLLAVRLFNRIKKLSGQNLPLSTLFEAPTVEQLASLLQQEKPTISWSCLVPIQPNGTRAPLFCIHGLGGNIVEFLHLARYLRPDQPFYGIQARGLDGKQPYFTRVEDFAAHYIKEIRALQPHGPYFLGGSSFGGLVAFEMARQLALVGERVGLLALFDSYGKDYPRPLERTTVWRRKLNNLRLRIDLHAGNLRALEPAERWAYVKEKIGQLPGRYYRRLMKHIDRIEERARLMLLPKMLRDQLRLTGESAKSVGRLNIPRAIRDVQVGVMQAARTYRLRPYDGDVTLFRATSQPPGIHPDRSNGWMTLVTGQLVIHDVPGYHGAIIREPRVKVLADLLNQCLDAAQQAPAPPATAEPLHQYASADIASAPPAAHARTR
jgi:acyl transferase domain-containing protein/thioesterase domain-containing protein/acyl carrier protein